MSKIFARLIGHVSPKVLDLFYSFRTRLLLVLATLLITTLGVQYYIYLRQNAALANILAEQDKVIAAGFNLAFDSVTKPERLEELRRRYSPELLTAEAGSVVNILVVDERGFIKDSLDPQYNPETLENGEEKSYALTDVSLPPLVDAGPPTTDIRRLLGGRLNPTQPQAGAPRAFPLRLDTRNGPRYIIVVLGSADTTVGASPWQAARSLLPTLAVLLAAMLVTTVLVWRFTQPLSDLSEAARRAAQGDFSSRVPAAGRRDEMGALALVFNEMIERVGRMRELEIQLHQAERSAVVGRLASAIAHEIRNPLNYINLTLDHLRTSLAPDDPDKRLTFMRLAEGVKTEVARINTRISEFLNYTRPSRLDLRSLDLRTEIIEDALRLVEAQAAETGVEIRVEGDGALPHVLGDRESLRSVFTNLIINALQAFDGNSGRLTVNLSAARGEVVARITDTGPGIAPENLMQIFEPYFSTKETGTGLGLAIVRKAIDDHHGHIEVESAPGIGTTFVVTLPQAEVRGQRSEVS